DALISGGITATKKAASLAEALGMRCEIHSFGYTLNQAANLQVIGSVANSRYFECPMPLGAYGDGMLDVVNLESDGTVCVPGKPGLIAPGHSFAWASPTAPAELLRSLTVEDTALRINPLKAPGMALWGLKFLRECNAERSSKNTLVKLRLAQYSQRMLDQISADEHIDYDDIHEGLLYLYRDQK